MRCGCKRRKERQPCSLVRQQLQDIGLPDVIEDSSAMHLLGCDSKCQQLKVRCPTPCSDAHKDRVEYWYLSGMQSVPVLD